MYVYVSMSNMANVSLNLEIAGEQINNLNQSWSMASVCTTVVSLCLCVAALHYLIMLFFVVFLFEWEVGYYPLSPPPAALWLTTPCIAFA